MNNPYKNYSQEELANLCWYQKEQIKSMWFFYTLCAFILICSFVGGLFGWYLGR
jgi:hypothetical protein